MVKFSITVQSPIGTFEGNVQELDEARFKGLQKFLEELDKAQYLSLECGSSTVYLQSGIIKNSAVILRLLA